jgi:AraC family transcriptional regulator, ethanolamine operon transcriptional activator
MDAFQKSVAVFSGMQGRYIAKTARVRGWRLRTVDLNGIEIVMGSEGAGSVYSGRASCERFHIWLVLGNGYGVTLNGADFGSRHIAWIGPGKPLVISADKPLRWLNIAISADVVARWAELHADEFDMRLLDGNVQQRASQSPLSLIVLARRLFHVDEQSAEHLHTPEAERAARAELMDTVLRTLLPLARGEEVNRRGMCHMKLLDRALELFELHGEDVVRIEDLCAATGVSERTLRNLFHKYLGMSPHRYMMMRRLDSIRSGICRAVPGDTITRICAQYGVWDFGRFSSQYRAYFGELPSRSMHFARNSQRSELLSAAAGDAR